MVSRLNYQSSPILPTLIKRTCVCGVFDGTRHLLRVKLLGQKEPESGITQTWANSSSAADLQRGFEKVTSPL